MSNLVASAAGLPLLGAAGLHQAAAGAPAPAPVEAADQTRPRTGNDVEVSFSSSLTSAVLCSSPSASPSSSSCSFPASGRPFSSSQSQSATTSPHSLRPSTTPASAPAAAGIAGREAGEIVTTTLAADPVPASASSIFSPRPPSHDSIPRQTLIKALASVARKNKPEALALPVPSMSGSGDGNDHVGVAVCDKRSRQQQRQQQQQQQQLDDVLSELSMGRDATPIATAFPAALKSPCFYHERLDDGVNMERILDAIRNDESMSHSRLVQTATGVRQIAKQLQRRPIKRAVRSVMIITKARDNQLVYLTRELAQWLLRTPRYGSDVGVCVYVDAKLRGSRRFDAAGIVAEDRRFADMLRYWTPDLCWGRPEMFDLVLTLGGDGTVLFTSWLFQRIVPPVLPFALGSLGFLTSFEFERYKDHLDRVMGDEGMRVSLRMRFTCTVFRRNAAAPGGAGAEPEEAEQFEVLNELVIDRGPSPYVSNLELYGDDELLTVIQADGCIFSTPTGSTAYSLSAGGSLVHPDIPCILLTPICPHTLSFRPMVLSDTMALRVSVPRASRATAYCAFDGKGRVELRQGDYVTITASQYPFPTVARTDTEWFDSVSRTLRWNMRAATQKAFDASSSSSSFSSTPVSTSAAPGPGSRPAEDDCGGDAEWDIDFDADSACYASEDGSISSASPLRKMSLLAM